MKYCEKCKTIYDDDDDVCAKNHRLREPKGNDLTYIISTDNITAAEIEDILAQNDIPCFKQGSLGLGVTAYMGSSTENFSIYVPYAAYDASLELLENFLE